MFKPGDRAMCIDARGCGWLREGRAYTINRTELCQCGQRVDVVGSPPPSPDFVGIAGPRLYVCRICCDVSTYTWFSRRFMRLPPPDAVKVIRRDEETIGQYALRA